MNIQTLQEYAKDGLNVLLVGNHGVGKTEIIKSIFGQQFGELNKDWLYFSGSTLDPWVDFIGIPKNYTREDGKEVFGIIPNERFTGEEPIKAIFIDELNRSDEKVQNAIMELIQFGSINGRKFKHLKCIWGAINPFDDESDDPYSVQKLDPAQEDRFHVKINVPNELNKEYLYSKYGKDIVDIFDQWRTNNDYTKLISPRRIDYMLNAYTKRYDLKDFIDEKINNVLINVNELKDSLNAILKSKEIDAIIKEGNEAIKKYFTLEQITSLASYIACNEELATTIYFNVDEEIAKKIESILKSNKEMLKRILAKKEDMKLKSFNKELNKDQINVIKNINDLEINESFLYSDFNKLTENFYKEFNVKNISSILDYFGKDIFDFKQISLTNKKIKSCSENIEVELKKGNNEKHKFLIKCIFYTLINQSNNKIKQFSKIFLNSPFKEFFNLNVANCRIILKQEVKPTFDLIERMIFN